MPYTVYKVTNKLTGEFYIGVHKTNDPHDSYLGSGKVIRAQVALHGPESFTKEIMASFDRRQDAYEKEVELIAPNLGGPGCLNIHPGGKGGFTHLGPETLKAYSAAGQRRIQELRETDPAFAEKLRTQRLRNVDRARENGTLALTAAKGSAAWTGKKHSLESRSLMSRRKRGAANNCYGTCWIMQADGSDSKRIPKVELDRWVSQGWIPGRRCKSIHAPVGELV